METATVANLSQYSEITLNPKPSTSLSYAPNPESKRWNSFYLSYNLNS